MPEGLRNWAGNLRYGTDRLHAPDSIDELCRVVSRLDRLRVLGTRHCFNALADSDAELISTERLDRIVAIDAEARTVTIEAGVTYAQLNAVLHESGFALPNLASLPHLNVAGAAATATHGSGDALRCLAAAVTALELINADGERCWLSREAQPATFPGAVVHLGALGVVARLTLRIEPTYDVVQHVYEHLPLEACLDQFDAITTAGTSVSLFTSWREPVFDQVLIKRRLDGDGSASADPRLPGARLAGATRHPIAGKDPVNCTPQREPGPWHLRLPHFMPGFTPSAGQELQAEYLVPREHAEAALRVVASLRRRIAPLLLVCEVRTVAADDLWLSMACGRPSVAIHFTLKPDGPGVAALLPALEAALDPFDARPHWGKLFTLSGRRLAALYPRLTDFRALARRMDPSGKFRNRFLERVLFERADLASLRSGMSD